MSKRMQHKTQREQGNENKLEISITRQFLLFCERGMKYQNKISLIFNKYCTNIAKKNTRQQKGKITRRDCWKKASKQKSQAKTSNMRHSERQIYGTLWEFVTIKKVRNRMQCFYHLWLLTFPEIPPWSVIEQASIHCPLLQNAQGHKSEHIKHYLTLSTCRTANISELFWVHMRMRRAGNVDYRLEKLKLLGIIFMTKVHLHDGWFQK